LNGRFPARTAKSRPRSSRAREGVEELLSSAESLARKGEYRKALALLEKTVDIH